MITNAEFVAIRHFDQTLAISTNEGQRLINKKNGDIVYLQDIITQLTAALIEQRSQNAGLFAQVKAFAAAHSDSALLKHTGKVYPSGKKQTVCSVIFDTAFDNKAIELGHAAPTIIRGVAK